MVNCVNCGAPIDLDVNKCPYCDTPYYDMSAINFDNNKPIALKFKWNNYIVTQLAIPHLESVEQKYDTVDVRGGLGQSKIWSYQTNAELTTNINFTAIPNKSGELMTVEVKKSK